MDSKLLALIVKGIDEASSTLKAIGGEVRDLGSEAASTAQDLQPLGRGLSAVGAAGAALISITALTAARVEVLGTVLYTVGETAGYTESQLDTLEAGVTELGITTGAARQGLVQMMQAELDLAEATDLASIAQDAAVIANTNSSAAYETLIRGLLTGRSVLLKSLGLTVDFNAAYKRQAELLGKNALELTANEKMQARLNEVKRAGAIIEGTYEAAMGDVGKKLTSMPRLTEEAARALGQAYLPAMEDAVDATSDMLKAFIDLEPEHQAGIANFIAIGTAVTGFGGVALLAIPKIVALKGALTALNLTMLGPVGLVAGGLAAVYAITQLPVPLGTAEAAMITINEASDMLTTDLYGLEAAEQAVEIATSNLTDGWTSQYSPALINARELTDGWRGNLWATVEAADVAIVSVDSLAISTSTFAGSLGELDFKNEDIWEMAMAAGASNEQMLALAVGTGKVTQAEADLTVQGWEVTQMWVDGKIDLDTYIALMADLESQVFGTRGEAGWLVYTLDQLQPHYGVNVHTTYTSTGEPPAYGGGGTQQYQSGTPYVPQTGWAYLHEGEAVLTKEENRAGRGGQGGGVVIHNHFGRDSVRSDEDIRTITDDIQRSIELQGLRSRIA